MPGFRSRQFNHNRPIAAVHVYLRMLRCGPSNRTFVYYAAFFSGWNVGRSGPSV
jgi:hypothetical protein